MIPRIPYSERIRQAIRRRVHALRRWWREARCRHEWEGTYLPPCPQDPGRVTVTCYEDGSQRAERTWGEAGNIVTHVETITVWDDFSIATARFFQFIRGGAAVVHVRCHRCRKGVLATCSTTEEAPA